MAFWIRLSKNYWILTQPNSIQFPELWKNAIWILQIHYIFFAKPSLELNLSIRQTQKKVTKKSSDELSSLGSRVQGTGEKSYPGASVHLDGASPAAP